MGCLGKSCSIKHRAYIVVSSVLLSTSGLAQQDPVLIKAATVPEVENTATQVQFDVLSTKQKRVLKNTWTMNRVKRPVKKEFLTAQSTRSALPPVIDQTEPSMLFVITGTNASFLQWHFDGQKYEAWTTADLSILGGVTEYMKDDKKHTTFIMADDAAQPDRFDHDVPADVTGFYLTKGDSANEEAMNVARDLVALCSTEQAYLIERAALKATSRIEKPPQRDITVNFWKVEKEAAQ